MKLTFNDKVALVSGAGRGIGKNIALALAKEGCTVICVSKNLSSCTGTADEINASGGKAEAFAIDVANKDAVKTSIDEISKKYPNIDILINNAGITRDNLMLRMTDDEWADVIDTNLNSCFYMTKALTRNMMSNRWGRIINITSVVGIMGNAGQANYASAKAGMIGFTKSLARELASRNITVNAIAPGFIETDMTAKLSPSIMAQAVSTIPLKKAGKPDDIANMCTYLSSEESAYITGQVIAIDGGLSM